MRKLELYLFSNRITTRRNTNNHITRIVDFMKFLWHKAESTKRYERQKSFRRTYEDKDE